MKKLPDNLFTAVVTDPPYGLSKQPNMKEVLKHWLVGDDYEHTSSGFMGKDWDSFVPGPKIWEQVMRVLKPGGHILSFSGTRTYDLMVTAMRLAGSEIRDKIDFYCEMEGYSAWDYGQGFPKSLAIGKAIDKMKGVERKKIGEYRRGMAMLPGNEGTDKWRDNYTGVVDVTAPATEEAKKWEGYGTALKPAHEPIAQFAKSLPDGSLPESPKQDAPFRYEAKASTRERNYGCGNLFWLTTNEGTKRISEEEHVRLTKENETNRGKEGYIPHRVARGNCWATVKPIELCRYLVRIVKMPDDNLILDPFCGSGTTAIACILEGCDFLTIDNDPIACEIAKARIQYFQCLGKKGLK